MPTAQRLKKMHHVLRNRQPDLTVVCENIHDPHNVSAMLRSCDAVGVETVHLLYTNQDFPELARQSSASASKWIDTRQHANPAALRTHLKEAGFTIYATSLNARAKSIYDIDWCKPSATILGNERFGVSEEALSVADDSIYVPMFGMIQSLNVSVATAVILYEACRQRAAANLYPNPALGEERLQAKLDNWSKR